MRPLPDPRRRLVELAAARHRVTLPGLSRYIGRGDNYLTRWAAGGPPARLDERALRLLGQFFGVPETELGGDDPRWTRWQDHGARTSDRKLGRST